MLLFSHGYNALVYLLLQLFEKISTIYRLHCLCRKQKFMLCFYSIFPVFVIVYSATTHNRVDMRMKAQLLPPCMKHRYNTWGQQLSFHPHIHSIVSGGGIDNNKHWKDAVKAKHKFLFPAKAVQPVYRAYFLKQLQQQIDKGIITMTEQQHKEWLSLRTSLYDIDWIVEFREPMGGPAQVLEYLGRYTHKVAISNHRIKCIDSDSNATFEYKDYTDDGKKKLMTLPGEEFIRRYEQHILPPRFCKIRH